MKFHSSLGQCCIPRVPCAILSLGKIPAIYIGFSKWTNHECVLFYHIILSIMLLEAIVLRDKGNHVPQPILKAMGNWESSLINRCFLCLLKENRIYLSSFLHIIQSACFKGHHVPQFILSNEIVTFQSSFPLTCPMSLLWFVDLDWKERGNKIPQVLRI